MLNEFSRILPLSNLRDATHIGLTATREECAALAKRFEIDAVDSLRATVIVTPGPGQDECRVTGQLEAAVVQECVVTFEPVRSRIDAAIERLFGPPKGPVREIELDPLHEEPEPLEGGRLDLGEIVAEELALALHPYPRAADADEVLEPYLAGDAAPDADEEPSTLKPLASLRMRPAAAGGA